VTKRRLLYLPIETKSRELLGKTFLAAKAVERGWIVVMGAHPDMRKFMLEHPAGLYVETSIPDAKAERLERIHSAGHRIANMCEESIVYADGRDYCTRKLGLASLRWTDLLLVPGQRNAEHIHAYRPEGDSKVVVTGNPRFDTLLPGVRCVYNHDAEAIKETFGRFVLVNTNFGRPNPHRPDDDPVAKLIARGMVHEGSEADFIRRHLSFKRRQMQGLQALLRDLAASGSAEKIVVRPHPVENHDVWREWAKPLNIEVRYEGSANNWMMAADAVVHPGCTTGMEGLLLDRAVFSYVPEADSEFIGEQDRASEWVTNAEELSNGLARVRGLGQQDAREGLTPQRERLRKSIVNVEPPYAADRILDELERADLPSVRPAQVGVGRGVVAKVIRAGRRWLPQQPPAKRDERSLQKFPGVAEEEISGPLAQWSDASILTQVPQITRFNDRLWVLH
jgi:surface carbohydrate biosynthesis protein